MPMVSSSVVRVERDPLLSSPHQGEGLRGANWKISLRIRCCDIGLEVGQVGSTGYLPLEGGGQEGVSLHKENASLTAVSRRRR
jgi:hypothetical protein